MKKEIELIFETDLPNEEYKLENNVFQLPLLTTPEKLNELLNKLLPLSEPKKFSFSIQNIKLTTSLENFVNSNLLTSEKAITINYILEIDKPEKMNTIKEDEWIKNIQLFQEMKYKGDKYSNYCVGLFNGEITFYSGNDNTKIYSIKNNCSNNKDVLLMLNDIKYFKINEKENNILIKTLKYSLNTYEIYNVDIKNQTQTLIYNEAKRDNECYNFISLNPTNFNIFALSGNENDKGVLKLFKLPDNLSLNEAKSLSGPKKKRKIESSSLKPEYVFNNLHKNECLYSVFLDNEYIVTGGDDYTINVYNIINKNLFLTYNTNYKNISSMCRVSNKTFIVGYADGTIKYYDLNENKAAAILRDPQSTYGYISDISMCNDKDKHPITFVTSSYDSHLRLWDIRGGKLPIYKINTEETEKNYAVKFNGTNRILSGGDGSSLNIFNY